MEYQIKLAPRAEKELEKLPRNDRLRVKAAFSYLRHNPYQGKKLQGKREKTYSMRVWPYRILYYLYQQDATIYITHVKHRRDVYR